MQPNDATRTGVGTDPLTGAASTPRAAEALAPRVAALYQRVMEMERALAIREWWLLGRDLPEAQALSEIVSLLAVVHGELAEVLAEVSGSPAVSEGDASPPIVSGAGETHLSDPQWVRERLTEARHLLDGVATVLPSLLQYAQVLRAHAERQALPSDAIDALAIVSSRLEEACEVLQHPPERRGR